MSEDKDEHTTNRHLPRPMVIEFDNDEEYEVFQKWATSSEKDTSEGATNLRNKLIEHREMKKRHKKQKEDREE